MAIDNWPCACFILCLTEMGGLGVIKLIFHNNSEEFPQDGEISTQTLADGLIHLHEAEPTTSELMAQMIYEDFVKNR